VTVYLDPYYEVGGPLELCYPMAVSRLDGTCVQLAPGVEVPPIIVGGMSDAALKRAAAYGDGWFAMPLHPAQLESTITRLFEFANERGRQVPAVIGSVLAAIDGDPGVPDRDELTRRITDPDGMFGMPAGAVPDILANGTPSAIAERLEAWTALGAERIVVTLATGDWHRQADLLARAVDQLA
jgi:alkanesulfonate monooxygenase SsuD/methylene tetrahydromethanopterin reductase-like flavin-dependent oxidoreductase (luciferase family)